METKLMRTKEWHCWKLWELKEALGTQGKKITICDFDRSGRRLYVKNISIEKSFDRKAFRSKTFSIEKKFRLNA